MAITREITRKVFEVDQEGKKGHVLVHGTTIQYIDINGYGAIERFRITKAQLDLANSFVDEINAQLA